MEAFVQQSGGKFAEANQKCWYYIDKRKDTNLICEKNIDANKHDANKSMMTMALHNLYNWN